MATVRDQRKEETRRRVFEAAVEIFRRDGVAASRIDDIATLAGVSRGTFYFHYPTKEDVLLEVLHESERQIVADLEDLPEDAPLSQVFDRLSAALCAAWEPDPRLLADVAAVALRSASSAAAMADTETDWLRGNLAVRFRAAAQRGELAAVLPPEMISDLYLGHVLCGLLAWFGNQTALSLRAVLGGVTHFFWQGAQAPP